MQGPGNCREYGRPPFSVVVVHGGPGAAGSMASVARELSRDHGVLEPFQTAPSIDGQAAELRDVLEKHGRLPVTLIGHSWGAWLCIIFTARYPAFVKKLILVASAPLEAKYALKTAETRMSRLGDEDRSELLALEKALGDPDTMNKNAVFARIGELMTKADAFYLLPGDEEKIEAMEDIYRSVWMEAEGLRRSGELLRLAKMISCPAVAIHGDYDPHPAEGVERPLKRAMKNFRFILLKKCGHEPWKERRARDSFYSILAEELDNTLTL